MKNTLFLFAVSVLLAACSIDVEETVPTVIPVAVDETTSADGITCTAEGVYPHISNLTSEQIAVNINSVFESYAREIEGNMNTCLAYMQDLLEEDANLTDTTTVAYDVKRLDDHFFSVTLTKSQYFEGAAHPNNSITTYTFSMRDGQPIDLADLFADDVNTEVLLTDLINDQLTAEGIVTPYPSETANGLGSYYLTDDALVLVDLFSVYAVQGIEVRIPFTAIQDELNPELSLLST